MVGAMDVWRTKVLTLAFQNEGGPIYWGEGTPVPADSRLVGEWMEVPSDAGERRRWQAAAEAYVTELAAADAERAEARIEPKRPFWWTARRRLNARHAVQERAQERFTERAGAAAGAYRPHRAEIAARVEARRQVQREEADARRTRMYQAFYTWHNHHEGNRTLAEKACWRSTSDGEVDVGGESDGYSLAAAVPEPTGWTQEARAEVETATGGDAERWWAWVRGAARNLAALDEAVAVVVEAATQTMAALTAAGNPGAAAHVGDSSPARAMSGWVLHFDRAALTPPPVPMPPAEALRDGWFSADLFVYGASTDPVLTVGGRIAATTYSGHTHYTRGQRRWMSVDVDWFAETTLDSAVILDGPSGHHIHFTHRVAHLLGPEVYVPFIEAAGRSMAATFRSLVR
jgi:hypothetical protein